jgi:hypothetical protein
MRRNKLVYRLIALLLLTAPTQAQMVPLTDWRAKLDADLARLSMPRDAHLAIVNILQAYEREEARAKAEAAKSVEQGK